jgi:hypothetical protein
MQTAISLIFPCRGDLSVTEMFQQLRRSSSMRGVAGYCQTVPSLTLNFLRRVARAFGCADTATLWVPRPCVFARAGTMQPESVGLIFIGCPFLRLFAKG